MELVQVDVERTIETKRGGNRRNDLSDDAVKVLESRRLDTEVLAADVVDSCRNEKELNTRTIKKREE